MFQLNHFRLPQGFFTGKCEVEIGFGKGDFLLHLAKKFPEKVFVGIEISGLSIDSIERRAKLVGGNFQNLFVIKLDAFWALKLFFQDHSIERIWLNFPDPWPKKRHEKRRLTKKSNLSLFARKLSERGQIVLRTDHEEFLNYSVQNAQELGVFNIKVFKAKEKSFEEVGIFVIDDNLHADEVFKILSEIPETKYERKWKEEGKTIWLAVFEKVKGDFEKIPEDILIKGMAHAKVDELPFNPRELCGKEFRISEGVVVKFFDVWEKENAFLIETLLAEKGMTHYFFTLIRKTPKGDWLLKISPFSEVLKTQAVVDFVNLLAKGKIK